MAADHNAPCYVYRMVDISGTDSVDIIDAQTRASLVCGRQLPKQQVFKRNCMSLTFPLCMPDAIEILPPGTPQHVRDQKSRESDQKRRKWEAKQMSLRQQVQEQAHREVGTSQESWPGTGVPCRAEAWRAGKTNC